MYTDGGRGASEACVAITIRELKRALSWLSARRESQSEPFTVEETDAAAIIEGGALERRRCRLLVMPGGRDLPYCSALNGAGNERIRAFVRNGGSYLGLCAGGYYGTSQVQFAVGDPVMEVAGPRELNFYPGVARGPMFPGFQYTSSAGARVCWISLRRSAGLNPSDLMRDMPALPVYYDGGCCFTESERGERGERGNVSGIEVLATYDTTTGVLGHKQDVPLPDGSSPLPDDPAAIVSMQYGTGKVMLSGVHIESSAAGLILEYSGDQHIEALAGKLSESETKRERLFNTLINHLVS